VCGAAVLDGLERVRKSDPPREAEKILSDSDLVQKSKTDVTSALLCAVHHPQEVIEYLLYGNATVDRL
jgi:hypothetical protein